MNPFKILTCLFAISLLYACDEEETLSTIPDGTYEGVFIRTHPNAKYAPSQVTLTFAKGEFEGESEVVKSPAICHGTYSIEGNKVVFVNLCIWTAEFDWTYILSGEFEMVATSDELILTRTIGQTRDMYQLKRK